MPTERLAPEDRVPPRHATSPCDVDVGSNPTDCDSASPGPRETSWHGPPFHPEVILAGGGPYGRRRQGVGKGTVIRRYGVYGAGTMVAFAGTDTSASDTLVVYAVNSNSPDGIRM